MTIGYCHQPNAQHVIWGNMRAVWSTLAASAFFCASVLLWNLGQSGLSAQESHSPAGRRLLYNGINRHALFNARYAYYPPSTSFATYNRYYNDRKSFWRKPSTLCSYTDEDKPFLEHNTPRHSKYIVINEPRSGSSWLQEISQMHPGIKVQFELDMEYGDDALKCKQCHRPNIPDSKFPHRLPAKLHPPQACGMTIFGSSNQFNDVQKLSEQHNASLVILVRKNHVAHAISAYRHFQRAPKHLKKDMTVPWNFMTLSRNVEDKRKAYEKLLEFPSQTKRRAHLIFYEDLKKNPEAVWQDLQEFLGIPHQPLSNIAELEPKSSSRPSVEYLDHAHALRVEAAGQDWYGMLSNPNYDDQLDISSEFASICSRYPNADLSWRRHSCASVAASSSRG